MRLEHVQRFFEYPNKAPVFIIYSVGLMSYPQGVYASSILRLPELKTPIISIRNIPIVHRPRVENLIVQRDDGIFRRLQSLVSH